MSSFHPGHPGAWIGPNRARRPDPGQAGVPFAVGLGRGAAAANRRGSDSPACLGGTEADIQHTSSPTNTPEVKRASGSPGQRHRSLPSWTSCPAMTPWISGDPQDQRHQPRPATDRADLVTIPALPGRRNPGLRLSYRSTCSDGTQAHVLAVIEHATGRTPGPHPYLEPGLSAGLLSDYETHHNQHRPHRFLRGAARLKALPEPADLAHYRVRRHARVAGLIHEYRLVP